MKVLLRPHRRQKLKITEACYCTPSHQSPQGCTEESLSRATGRPLIHQSLVLLQPEARWDSMLSASGASCSVHPGKPETKYRFSAKVAKRQAPLPV